MKKSINSAILILSLVMAILFCQSKKESNSADSCNCVPTSGKSCVVYQETYCADPWGHDFLNDIELVNAINGYHLSLTITLNEIGIEITSAPESCNACDCKTGRAI